MQNLPSRNRLRLDPLLFSRAAAPLRSPLLRALARFLVFHPKVLLVRVLFARCMVRIARRVAVMCETLLCSRSLWWDNMTLRKTPTPEKRGGRIETRKRCGATRVGSSITTTTTTPTTRLDPALAGLPPQSRAMQRVHCRQNCSKLL